MSCVQNLGKVVKRKPTLTPALPEILITETMLMSRQQQSWTLLNSKDSQDFIKKFLSWCRLQISFLGMMPNARGRTMKPNLKEPGKKFTWILPASLTTGLKSDTLHPMHTQKATGSSTSHDLNWSSPGGEWCWKALPLRGPKWNKLHSILICYLSQVETGIKKLSDYKLNKKLLKQEIMQKLFTLINNCICMLWDMVAGPSPEVFQAEVLQGPCAYLEY